MATTKFRQEQLENFFSGKYFHKSYKETVELANEIKIHSDGEFPVDLIDERRPSESMAVKDYRKKIWEPITKPVFSKINTYYKEQSSTKKTPQPNRFSLLYILQNQ